MEKDATSPTPDPSSETPCKQDSDEVRLDSLGDGHLIKLDMTPRGRDVGFQTTIEEDRARTENRIALILVIAVVASLPTLLAYMWMVGTPTPDSSPHLDIVMNAFDRWVTLVGPLAGAAVGIGYQIRRNDQ